MGNLLSFDASSIRDDYKKLRNAYYEDGGLIIRQLLPMNLINKLAKHIIRIVSLIDNSAAQNCPISINSESVKAASWILQEVEKIRPGIQSVVYDAMTQIPLMHKIAASESILRVSEFLLSKELLIHPKLIVLMSMPNETWHLARWHQDLYYNEGPENTCTVYAPLQFVNAENGGLLVAKNELKRGLLHHADNHHREPTKWHTLSQEVITTFSDLAQIEMDAGDVLFLHSLSPHTALVNKSEDVRFVLNLRYQDMTDKRFHANGWRIENMPHARNALNRNKPQEEES